MTTNLIMSNRVRKVHISTMTGKLLGIPAINTDTTSNAFCNAMFKEGRKDNNVCTHCYSQNMLRTFRKTCVTAFRRNSETLSERELTDQETPILNATYVRMHGHGELINDVHLENFYRVAEANPATTFALWTKRKDLIRSARTKPSNMILVYSNPKLDKVFKAVPLGFDKVFNNTTNEYPEQDKANCTGQKCASCLACYTHSGATVIVEHVK